MPRIGAMEVRDELRGPSSFVRIAATERHASSQKGLKEVRVM